MRKCIAFDSVVSVDQNSPHVVHNNFVQFFNYTLAFIFEPSDLFFSLLSDDMTAAIIRCFYVILVVIIVNFLFPMQCSVLQANKKPSNKNHEIRTTLKQKQKRKTKIELKREVVDEGKVVCKYERNKCAGFFSLSHFRCLHLILLSSLITSEESALKILQLINGKCNKMIACACGRVSWVFVLALRGCRNQNFFQNVHIPIKPNI